MRIYDQHLHSFLSSDCSEKQENYIDLAIEKGLTHFVTTEHLDLSCTSLGFDDIYNLVLQDELVKKYQKKYNTLTFLKGVELGYKYSRIKDIETIVQSNDYDVIIMSIHEDEIADCTTKTFLKNLSADQAYEKYLNLYINMLENISCFDIVGHIDFILRYIDKVHIEKHKDKLTQTLELVIEKDKSLELNTRFLYRHKDNSYLKYIFALYHSLGGRKLSLGSDAHTSNDYMGSFDEALALLKEVGFTELCFYQKRKEITLKI